MHTRPIAATAFFALAGLGHAPSALAFNPQPDPPARIGAVSLPPGQVLRLNARVIGAAATSAEVPPVPCRVTLGFVDAEGRGLGQSLIALLRPGQSTRLDLAGDAVSSAGNPLSAHPVVRVLPAVQRTLPAVQSCNVALTLEVLDSAGRTTAVLAEPQLYTPDSSEQ